MTSKIQDGIFYNREKHFISYSSSSPLSQKNCTFALVFIRITNGSSAQNVHKILSGLWRRYELLKKGLLEEIPGCNIPSGMLHVLIAYGPLVFKLEGIKKKIPNDMRNMQFLPSPRGGEPILRDSGIRFARDSHDNVGLSEHVGIQFIGTSQLAVYRAIVETGKYLDSQNDRYLKITKFFTGFQRDDGRSWLGFHDEVSNMSSSNDARDVISINRRHNHLSFGDLWTIQGTYLVFLRIMIDLHKWNRVSRKEQEFIVGRDKETGRPLIGVDKAGNPILSKTCHKFSEIFSFDKEFHDHPDYFREPLISDELKPTIDLDASVRVLNQSHIGRTRHIENITPGDPASNRIFRQGFEFIEASRDMRSPIKVGQNFISFQNDPARIFSILTDPHWLGKSNFGGVSNKMGNLLSVIAAGVFFVPPKENLYPGACLFI